MAWKRDYRQGGGRFAKRQHVYYPSRAAGFSGVGTGRKSYNPYSKKYTVPRSRGWAGNKSEHKYLDSFLQGAALTSATGWLGTEFDPATDNTLFVPVEGNDINNRVGRKVTLRSLRIRGNISIARQANQTATDAAMHVRMIVYQDMQTNAAQAQGEDLMALPGGATGLLAVNTFQSLNNLGRFKVLKDKIMNIGNPNMVWDGTNVEQNVSFQVFIEPGNDPDLINSQGLIRPFKITCKFRKPVDIRFNITNGGSVADIIDNSFHLIINASSIELAPVVSYQCRGMYTDA